jgi:hypothetical protein
MFASGRIEPGQQTVLTVPESALVLRDGRSYLFEVNAENKVIRRTVTAGVHREGLVEIDGGLDEKARIITAGGAFLADGDLVNIIKEDGNQVR